LNNNYAGKSCQEKKCTEFTTIHNAENPGNGKIPLLDLTGIWIYVRILLTVGFP
jgi:hypothetical protein